MKGMRDMSERAKVTREILHSLGRPEPVTHTRMVKGRKEQFYKTAPVVVHSVEGKMLRECWTNELSRLTPLPVDPRTKIVF